MARKFNPFLSITNVTVEDIKNILAVSFLLKYDRHTSDLDKLSVRSKDNTFATPKSSAILANTDLRGKKIALLFEKNSTRTRSAFESAIVNEGAHSVYMNAKDSHLGSKESIEDTAQTLSCYFDLLVYRGYEQSRIERLQEAANIPVINALSNELHPTQVVADTMTMIEACVEQDIYKDVDMNSLVQKGLKTLAQKKIVYIGNANNNITNSLIHICATLNLSLVILAPSSHMTKTNISSYKHIHHVTDIKSGLEGADFVYTDVWTSMGFEVSEENNNQQLKPYAVTNSLMSYTNKAYFLHCLPAKRGFEVYDDVIDGKQSLVWSQAENKMHSARAIMKYCMSSQ